MVRVLLSVAYLEDTDFDTASVGFTSLSKLTNGPQINHCFMMTAVFKGLRPGTDTEHTIPN